MQTLRNPEEKPATEIAIVSRFGGWDHSSLRRRSRQPSVDRILKHLEGFAR
jgi:hypothetical protein